MFDFGSTSATLVTEAAVARVVTTGWVVFWLEAITAVVLFSTAAYFESKLLL